VYGTSKQKRENLNETRPNGKIKEIINVSLGNEEIEAYHHYIISEIKPQRNVLIAFIFYFAILLKLNGPLRYGTDSPP
jgi:hypothetical protein